VNRAWTREEERQLVILREIERKGWYEIADIMNRTADSVRMKWRNSFGETGKFSDPKQLGERVPVIGIFDVETLPMIVYTWSTFRPFISPDMVIEETCFLSWAGKYLNDPVVYSDILTPKEVAERDGFRITKTCWDFINNCDVLVGHNLERFDMKVVNTFFLKAGLPPLRPVQIDTLKVARKNFKFSFNRMGHINKFLDIRTKIENEGFPFWRKCSEGDEAALNRMKEYNEGDILALEELFYIIRPYITDGKFNYNLYSDLVETVCPICGSKEFSFNGYYYTPAGKWESLRCSECKTLFRAKENLFSKEKKRSLVVPQ